MRERIKQLRLALGYTLKDFGDKIGMSLTGLSSLERGQNDIKERHIRLIMAAFPQVSETWLRTGQGEMFGPPDPIAGRNLPAVAKRLVRAYEQLTPEQQRAVDAYLDRVILDLQTDETEAYIAAKTAEYEAGLRAELEAEKGAASPSTSTA